MVDFDVIDNFFTEQSRPQVKKREWMNTVTMERGTEENLRSIIDACIESKRFALDLETTGLNCRVYQGRTISRIVGVCLAPDEDHGYYIPLGHEDQTYNLPWSVFEKEFQRLMDSDAVAVFHNGKFDQTFLEYHGGKPWRIWDDVGLWDDSEILCYLRNTRERNKRLKFLSKRDLGFEMIELDDLFLKDHVGGKNFALLDPGWEPVIWYGASDAICTLRLANMYVQDVVAPEAPRKDQRTIYNLEKRCVSATRWMERNCVTVDRELVAELITIGQREFIEATRDIYAGASEILGRNVRPTYVKVLLENPICDNPDNNLSIQIAEAQKVKSSITEPTTVKDEKGEVKVDEKGNPFPFVYDMRSDQQMGQMFVEMKIPGLKRTEKSGQVKTSKDEISKVIERTGDKFPFMKRIQKYRAIETALSTFLYPLYEDSETHGNLWINFQGIKVDTGRFSSPGRKKKHGLFGGTSYNLQATPSKYDEKRPECMRRIRDCIVSRPVEPESVEPIADILRKGGYDPDDQKYYRKFFAAIDFSGVELRLVTNISGEPKWIEEFFRCGDCGQEFPKDERPPMFCTKCGSDKIGDLHTLSARNFYGDDFGDRPDRKQLRQNAKGVNFALCYGGGGAAVRRTIGFDRCTKQEGWRIKNQFDKGYTGLTGWWSRQDKIARQKEYVETAMGRVYPVPDINHEDGFFRSKAERNAKNGPIQGSSADLTKLAMVLIYGKCKKKGWLNKCRMVLTMHDELGFEIDGDILEEALEMIVDCMVNNRFIQTRNWPVYLQVEVELGFSWAAPWSYEKIQNGDKECPEELRPFITINKKPKEKPEKEEAEPVKEVKEAQPPTTLKETSFTYKLKVPLVSYMVDALAQVIAESLDRDGSVLDLQTQEGEPITWENLRRVNPEKFEALMKEKGL
jgi:DNA polymerase I-like protein with 3'-5' exonuclease and polymerase domains